MPAVRPTQREKIRYIAFQVETQDSTATREEVESEVSRTLLNFAGLHTIAKSGMDIIMVTKQGTGFAGVIKTERDHVDTIRAGIACLRSLNNKPAWARTRIVSGMIAKAKEGMQHAS